MEPVNNIENPIIIDVVNGTVEDVRKGIAGFIVDLYESGAKHIRLFLDSELDSESEIQIRKLIVSSVLHELAKVKPEINEDPNLMPIVVDSIQAGLDQAKLFHCYKKGRIKENQYIEQRIKRFAASFCVLFERVKKAACIPIKAYISTNHPDLLPYINIAIDWVGKRWTLTEEQVENMLIKARDLCEKAVDYLKQEWSIMRSNLERLWDRITKSVRPNREMNEEKSYAKVIR